jgi:hypothetical protein
MPYVSCFSCQQEYLKQYLFVLESFNFHFCSECEAIWNDDGHGNPIEKFPVERLEGSLRATFIEGKAEIEGKVERIFDHTLFNVEAKEVKNLILEAWSSPNKQKDPTPAHFLSNYWIVEMNRPVGRSGETKILLEERSEIIIDAAPVPFWHPGDFPDIHEYSKSERSIYEKAFVLEGNSTIEKLILKAWSMPLEFKKRQNSYSWLIDMTQIIGSRGETKVILWHDPRDGRFIGMMPVR